MDEQDEYQLGTVVIDSQVYIFETKTKTLKNTKLNSYKYLMEIGGECFSQNSLQIMLVYLVWSSIFGLFSIIFINSNHLFLFVQVPFLKSPCKS